MCSRDDTCVSIVALMLQMWWRVRNLNRCYITEHPLGGLHSPRMAKTENSRFLRVSLVYLPTAEGNKAVPLFTVLVHNPNGVLGKLLRSLWDDRSPELIWRFSVRGLKCLQRQALILRRTCRRSDVEERYEGEGWFADAEVRTEVLL